MAPIVNRHRQYQRHNSLMIIVMGQGRKEAPDLSHAMGEMTLNSHAFYNKCLLVIDEKGWQS